MACPLVSDEGLVCTLEAGHPGHMHKDQSDPSTEIQWSRPRAPQAITLDELVDDVTEKVSARAAALLAQAPTLLPAPRPGLFARLPQFFPGRRPISGARRTGS